MRDLARYFLALVVVGTGFYAAQQHRRPEQHPKGEAVASRVETDVVPPRDGREWPATESSGALPVAALADIDRVPLLGPDRANVRGKPADTSANFVTRPPILRADKTTVDSATPEPVKEKETVADAAGRDTKKQASAKPSPKKQEKRKTATAKSAGAGQSTSGTDEKTLSNRKATEAGKPMWQDAYRDGFPSTFESAQDKDPIPPEFAHEYQPYFQFAEDASNRTSASPTKSRRPEDNNRSSLAENQPASRRPPAAAPRRRHRIVEGDTLPRLAQEYLGSRDRYLELFQANSDVLFDPRLIPIGVEIVIPNRTTVVAHAASTPTTAAVVEDVVEKAVVEKDDASKYDYLWDTSVPLPGVAEN